MLLMHRLRFVLLEGLTGAANMIRASFHSLSLVPKNPSLSAASKFAVVKTDGASSMSRMSPIANSSTYATSLPAPTCKISSKPPLRYTTRHSVPSNC